MLSEKLIVLANNTEKVFNAGYNKCLKENPPGATEEELQAKYNEGYSKGEEEGLEYTLNGLIEITKIQESYLAEPMSFYILNMMLYEYEYEKIECMTSDTWEDIIVNDYNGIISQIGFYIDENGYVRYRSGGNYLSGNNNSFCKFYEKPIPDMSYRPGTSEPTE